MAGWLQKIIAPQASSKEGQLPVQRPGQPPGAPQPLPNATVIYGIGASLMFVASLFLLVHGRWFPALIVLVLGACLAGFALHLLKHQD